MKIYNLIEINYYYCEVQHQAPPWEVCVVREEHRMGRQDVISGGTGVSAVPHRLSRTHMPLSTTLNQLMYFVCGPYSHVEVAFTSEWGDLLIPHTGTRVSQSHVGCDQRCVSTCQQKQCLR